MATIGVALDYAMLARQKSQLQAMVDSSALRAARELHLAQVGSSDVVTSIAKNYLQAALSRSGPQLASAATDVALLNNNSSLQVAATAVYRTQFLHIPVNIGARAVATASGFPICALGLNQQAPGTIHLEANARVTAQFCAVQSNSTNPQGLSGAGNSVLTAASICSAGGKVGNKVNYSPDPLTDCPVLPDPLASRPAPAIGPCNYNNEVVSSGTVALLPGVYCGGLHVTGGANVTLTPGVYIMKAGPLLVDNGSTFTAQSAGVFLHGAGANFQFDASTSISMTAPQSGVMAGMLLFEDPSAPAGGAHQILSNNAPLLLGTIYTPKGTLVIDTNNYVAQQSAFTIIVANKMQLYGGPNLVLNSNYHLTNVPVPGGLDVGYPYLSK
ncbi:pilus assembly protein [Methylocystis heyeri]|uniref:Pilus assembly protein n=2 Tax=Methylocystis heyeri TaxID=391905 RepID=A0A6B8KJL0_9HYPH|nr:pilus assembly protein [Methylocystis heyeri]